MLANNNLKVCWTLAKRDFRFHRAKNCILALAVALVTGLYAFMFLLGRGINTFLRINPIFSTCNGTEVFPRKTEEQK